MNEMNEKIKISNKIYLQEVNVNSMIKINEKTIALQTEEGV